MLWYSKNCVSLKRNLTHLNLPETQSSWSSSLHFYPLLQSSRQFPMKSFFFILYHLNWPQKSVSVMKIHANCNCSPCKWFCQASAWERTLKKYLMISHVLLKYLCSVRLMQTIVFSVFITSHPGLIVRPVSLLARIW